MTRFNPNADLVPIEDWEAIAEHKAMETGATWRILGGILAGGVGIALSLELLGIVACSWLCYSAFERIRCSGKDLRAVRDFGCVAHLLDEQEFRSFTRQFGDSEIYQQVTFALDRGWNVSKHALNWLDAHEKGRQLEPAWKQDKPTLTPTQEVRELNHTPQVEKLERQFESIPAPTTTITRRYDPQEGSEIDLVGEMTDRIQNTIIIGQGGSGKGMLLANAMRFVKAKHPGKKIFVINGKDSDREAGYFDGVADEHHKLQCDSAKPGTVAAWFEDAIEKYHEYAAQNDGALLVIDEATIIGARLKTAKSTALVDTITGVCSCGDEQGKNIWMLGQTPFVGSGGLDLTGMSQMPAIVIVRSNGIGVLNQWKRAAIFEKIDSKEVAKLANESDCDRAVYWSGTARWYSMPKLTNYSAFDRDTRTYIKDSVTPKKETSTDTRQYQINTQIEVNTDLLNCVFDKIFESEKLNFDTLRKHCQRKLPELSKIDAIRDTVQHLINEGLVLGNEDNGYQIAP